MQGPEYRVRGYNEFQRAIRRADKESRTETRAAFRESGDVLRVEWANRLRVISAKSAAGLRTRVRTRGISVEQTIGKTTGLRPDFGALQKRRGVASLEAKRREIEHSFEKALDRIADHFDR